MPKKRAKRTPKRTEVDDDSLIDQLQDEELAKAIERISLAVSRLRSSGLNERAIIALVHDDTGLGKRVIKDVLDSLDKLAARYTDP